MAKILIIDDDPDIVEAMKVVLRTRDYKVTSAVSGEEGLKKVKTDKPDLVMLDIMMEKDDFGFDVARELKNNPSSKGIPILMLTAIKEKTGLDFKKEAGDEVWFPVDDYIEKPMKPEELLNKVEKLLQTG